MRVHGLRIRFSLPGILVALVLAACNPLGKEQQPKYVLHLTLQDPELARMDVVEVVIADVANPAVALEKIFREPVPPSGRIPAKTLSTARDPFLVRVRGIRGDTAVGLETHIFYEGGRKRVVKQPLPPLQPLNRLTRLTPSVGIMVPTFHPESLAYRVITPEGATKVSLNVRTEYSRALLTIDGGDTIRTGGAERSFDLGSRPRTVGVTVTDLGVPNFYTVALMPAPVTQPRLERLEISPASVTLNPPFDPAGNYFEATVPAGVEAVEVRPFLAANSNMSLRVNQQFHVSGQPRSIPLGPEPGATANVTITVILFDTRGEYSIKLVRAQ